MSWATIKSVLAAFNGIVGLIRDFFSWKRSSDDRQAGRDAVLVDQARQKDERLKEANEAEIEADKAHKTMPGDEAFDNEFRRD